MSDPETLCTTRASQQSHRRKQHRPSHRGASGASIKARMLMQRQPNSHSAFFIFARLWRPLMLACTRIAASAASSAALASASSSSAETSAEASGSASVAGAPSASAFARAWRPLMLACTRVAAAAASSAATTSSLCGLGLQVRLHPLRNFLARQFSARLSPTDARLHSRRRLHGFGRRLGLRLKCLGLLSVCRVPFALSLACRPRTLA